MRINWPLLILGALPAVVFAYGTAFAYIKLDRQWAYGAVKIGDAENVVIAKFGNPSVKDNAEKLFARYASSKCQSPCVERWWYENRLGLDIEAWSVSFDGDRKVIEKYH